MLSMVNFNQVVHDDEPIWTAMHQFSLMVILIHKQHILHHVKCCQKGKMSIVCRVYVAS